MRNNLATPYVIYYDAYRGQRKMDVRFECPFCMRRSHVVILGNRKSISVEKYLHGDEKILTQDLPFEQPIRMFLRDGLCRECQDTMLGETSKKIKYIREKKGEII